MADSLKDRVARLEAEVAELRAALGRGAAGGWRRAVDKYTGDEDLLVVFAEAKKLRESQRRAVRHRQSRNE